MPLDKMNRTGYFNVWRCAVRARTPWLMIRKYYYKAGVNKIFTCSYAYCVCYMFTTKEMRSYKSGATTIISVGRYFYSFSIRDRVFLTCRVLNYRRTNAIIEGRKKDISRRIVFDWPHATHMDCRSCPM